MKIYFMLKPGFVSDELVDYVKKNIFTDANRCSILDEGKAQYNREGAKKHYNDIYKKYIDSGKTEFTFYKGMEDYIVSSPVYGMVVDFDGTEDEWKEFRIEKIGATKNPAPGSLRYDWTIGKGQPYIVDANVAHSSDSILAGEKEIAIYYEMRGNALEKQ